MKSRHSRKPDLSSSRSLLVVENAPLREEALRVLREANRQLDDLRRQWTDFQVKDQPAYQSWIQLSFSETLEQIQKRSQEVLEKRALVEAVMREAAEAGLTFAEAYENVVNGNTRSLDPRADEETLNFPDDDEEAEAEEGTDQTEGLGRDAGSEYDFSGDENDSHSFRRVKERGPILSLEQTARLKKIYRLLAQRLHPDAAGESSADSRRSAFWLETQEAYDAGNLHKLEAIWEIVSDGGTDRVLPSESLSELRARFEAALRLMRGLQRNIRSATRNPAWGFSSKDRRPSQVRKIFQSVRRELESELEDISEALAALETFIDHWLNPEIASDASVRYRKRHGQRF